MNENDSRFYLAEIILAVDHLHQQSIIYRDLKPDNILLDKDGHIKIIDFGFAKVIQNIYKDRAYTNCGTPGYCAPEVMLDAGHTYKADIWSIGILICEMMGGFTPFQNKHEANNPKAIMDKCRSGKLNLPKNLIGNARDLVKLLLTDDPQSRLDISLIKQHKFFRAIDWTKLKKRLVRPPYIPEYQEHDRIFVSSDFTPGEQHINSGLPFLNNSEQYEESKHLEDIPETEEGTQMFELNS